jgi:hypothetical protein
MGPLRIRSIHFATLASNFVRTTNPAIPSGNLVQTDTICVECRIAQIANNKLVFIFRKAAHLTSFATDAS